MQLLNACSCFFNVYLPYQYDDNYDVFVEYIGKLSALIDEVSTSNLILPGDFNAAVNTTFESELVDLCTSYKLIISDYITYGRDSGQFTYVSDAHHSTSWLDHIVCSHDIYSKLTLIKIHDKLSSSDHLPLSACIDIPLVPPSSGNDYIVWRNAGRPRLGTFCSDMRRSRLRFKYALRQCNQNEKSIRADQYAKSLMNNDMTSFWDSIRKSSNTRIPPASMIDNCTGEENIAHMWQGHYNSLLNSVKGNSSKQVIHDMLGTIPCESKSILFTNSDLNSPLKRGKACGVDGLAAEHFIVFMLIVLLMYFLSLLFNAFVRHGYLPTDFMKTAIVPIIKNKTGDTSDKNNYRPIALVTATSKLFEICLLEILKCTLLHMITSLDLKQNPLLTCVFLL